MCVCVKPEAKSSAWLNWKGSESFTSAWTSNNAFITCALPAAAAKQMGFHLFLVSSFSTSARAASNLRTTSTWLLGVLAWCSFCTHHQKPPNFCCPIDEKHCWMSCLGILFPLNTPPAIQPSQHPSNQETTWWMDLGSIYLWSISGFWTTIAGGSILCWQVGF